MPFGIVACTFSDNFSRNSCILGSYFGTRLEYPQDKLQMYFPGISPLNTLLSRGDHFVSGELKSFVYVPASLVREG